MTICNLRSEASYNLPQIPRAEIDSHGRFIGGDPNKYLWPPGPRGKAQGALQSVQAEFGVGLDRGALRPGLGPTGAGVEYWEMLEFGNKWIPWTPLLDRDHYIAAASFHRYGAGWSFGPAHNLHDEAAGKFAELCGAAPDPLQKGDLDHDMTLYIRMDAEWRERFGGPVTPVPVPEPAPPVTPQTPLPPPGPPLFAETMDAREWAMAFVQRARENPGFATDEGNMLAWFANAIMRGFDIARARYEDATPLATAVDLDAAKAAILAAVQALDEQIGSERERAWWANALAAERTKYPLWPRYLARLDAILAAREAADKAV